jgi:hypothetical protein
LFAVLGTLAIGLFQIPRGQHERKQIVPGTAGNSKLS